MFKALLSNLLGGWAPYVMAALLAACGTFYGLWQLSAARFDTYKAEVAAAGEKAEADKRIIEAQHQNTLKEVTNAWDKYNAESKKQAVDNYVARFGKPAPCRVPDAAGESPVPGDAAGATVLHGAEQERVAAPDAEFVKACSDDAFFRIQVRTWAEHNHLKVEDAPQ